MTQKVVFLTTTGAGLWADPGDTNGGLLDSVEVIGGGGGGEKDNGSDQCARYHQGPTENFRA